MGDSSGKTNAAAENQASQAQVSTDSVTTTPPPSFVKQAMRNAVHRA